MHVSCSPELGCHRQPYRGALPLPEKIRIAHDLSILINTQLVTLLLELDASTYNHEWGLSYQSIFLRQLN